MKKETCKKSGIKIHESDNNYINDPFHKQEQQEQHKQKNTALDLNIDNYSVDDLFILFSIKTKILDDCVEFRLNL